MSLRRPILKGLSTGDSQPGVPSFRGHVHFPPTPEISATYVAHSARTYDRSAIVVSPNVCSLPKRHCPDRTYVLTEGKGEARLLKSVQTKDVQEDEDADGTPYTEYGQGAVRLDYFSIPLSSSMPEIACSESDDSDELLSPPSETEPNCGHSEFPILDLSVHDTSTTRGASEHHEHVQAVLPFLLHPRPPAVEQVHNISLRDHNGQDRSHTFSRGEGSHAPHTRSRRSRRESYFTTDMPPDLGCLGGF